MILKIFIIAILFYISTAKELESKHTVSFGQSFTSIVVSEIGDKTFFLAAIMSMKYNRVAVWIGAAAALVLMTVLSCAFGMVIPQLVSRFYTEIIVTIIFYVFAVKLLYTWYTVEQEGEELHEVEQEMENLDKQLMSLSETDQVQNDVTPKPTAAVVISFRSILWQSFILTFLGEWGDRSQITTISLAAVQNPVVVCLGGSLGHLLCTSIAVGGGKLLANQISERTVNLVGGIVFLIFALHHTYDLFSFEENY